MPKPIKVKDLQIIDKVAKDKSIEISKDMIQDVEDVIGRLLPTTVSESLKYLSDKLIVYKSIISVVRQIIRYNYKPKKLSYNVFLEYDKLSKLTSETKNINLDAIDNEVENDCKTYFNTNYKHFKQVNVDIPNIEEILSEIKLHPLNVENVIASCHKILIPNIYIPLFEEQDPLYRMLLIAFYKNSFKNQSVTDDMIINPDNYTRTEPDRLKTRLEVFNSVIKSNKALAIQVDAHNAVLNIVNRNSREDLFINSKFNTSTIGITSGRLMLDFIYGSSFEETNKTILQLNKQIYELAGKLVKDIHTHEANSNLSLLINNIYYIIRVAKKIETLWISCCETTNRLERLSSNAIQTSKIYEQLSALYEKTNKESARDIFKKYINAAVHSSKHNYMKLGIIGTQKDAIHSYLGNTMFNKSLLNGSIDVNYKDFIIPSVRRFKNKESAEISDRTVQILKRVTGSKMKELSKEDLKLLSEIIDVSEKIGNDEKSYTKYVKERKEEFEKDMKNYVATVTFDNIGTLNVAASGELYDLNGKHVKIFETQDGGLVTDTGIKISNKIYQNAFMEINVTPTEFGEKTTNITTAGDSIKDLKKVTEEMPKIENLDATAKIVETIEPHKPAVPPVFCNKEDIFGNDFRLDAYGKCRKITTSVSIKIVKWSIIGTLAASAVTVGFLALSAIAPVISSLSSVAVSGSSLIGAGSDIIESSKLLADCVYAKWIPSFVSDIISNTIGVGGILTGLVPQIVGSAVMVGTLVGQLYVVTLATNALTSLVDFGKSIYSSIVDFDLEDEVNPADISWAKTVGSSNLNITKSVNDYLVDIVGFEVMPS